MGTNTDRVLQLFDELIERGEEIKKVCKRLYFAGSKKTLAPETFEAWKIECLSLLKSTFGASSPHYDSFTTAKFFDYYNSTQIYLGILRGAREDLKNGYFFHKDLMLSVNIYHCLISRARVYLRRGEEVKAAAVLETALMEILVKICENKRITADIEDDLPRLLERLNMAGVLGEELCRSIEDRIVELNRSAGTGESFAGWIQEFLNEYLGSQIMILN